MTSSCHNNVLENKELYRSTSKETNGKWGTRETMNTFDSWLHHQVAISHRILVVCQIITVKFDENLFSCVNEVKK